MIFDAVDSPNVLSTRTVSMPSSAIQPDRTVSPSCAVRGTDSPVSARVSSEEEPDRITPSSGTRSPGRTTIVSPILTDVGETASISSP